LPEGLLSNLSVSSLKIYASIYNLYTFTSWYGGGDPEVETVLSNGNRTYGIAADAGTYPVPRSFSMGLKVSF
jgi:hypothetical protein